MNDFQATQDRGWSLVFIAWLVASVSTLAALFLGEVMGYTPCVLCWYQRICMFPLVLILAAGLFPFDRRVVRYALPLALAGWLLAVFHWGVASGLIPERVTPCSQGVPCSHGTDRLVRLPDSAHAFRSGFFHHHRDAVADSLQGVQMKKTLFISAAVVLLLAFWSPRFSTRPKKPNRPSCWPSRTAPDWCGSIRRALGPTNAKVGIVEFLDPACETCRRFYPFVKDMLIAHPERIHLVAALRPVPPECRLCGGAGRGGRKTGQVLGNPGSPAGCAGRLGGESRRAAGTGLAPCRRTRPGLAQLRQDMDFAGNRPAYRARTWRTRIP